MFANNPIYRWQTFGEHAMVFNALHVLERHAGRRDAKTSTDGPAIYSFEISVFGSIDDLRSTIDPGSCLHQALLPHFLHGLLHHFGHHLRAVLRISVSLSPAHTSAFFGTLKISVSSETMRSSRT